MSCRPRPIWSLLQGDLAPGRPAKHPLSPARLRPRGRLVVELYFPFCRRRCRHCTYPVMAVERGEESLVLEWYMKAVAGEARLYRGMLGGARLVFRVRGGSPGIAPRGYWARLVDEVSSILDVEASSVELEAEPREGLAEAVDGLPNPVLRLGVDTIDPCLRAGLGKQSVQLRVLEDLAGGAGAATVFTVLQGLPGERLAQHLSTLRLLSSVEPPVIEVREYMVGLGACLPPVLDRRMSIEGDGLLSTEGFRRIGCCLYVRSGSPPPALLSAEVQVLGLGPGSYSVIGLRQYHDILDPEEYCSMISRGVIPARRIHLLSRRAVRARMLVEKLFWRGEAGMRAPRESGVDNVVRAMKAMGLLEQRGGRLVLTRRALPEARHVYWGYKLGLHTGMWRAVNPKAPP